MSRSSARQNHDVWRGRFERFSRSGLPVARFCAQERVSLASFYYWRKKLRPQALRRHTSNAGRADAFQPLRVVPAASGVWIQLPGGTQIEVCSEHPDAVRAVIAEVAHLDRGVHIAGVDGGPEVK